MHPDLFDGEASFSGNFGKDCQTNSVPKSLLMLVQMILEGTNLSLATDNQTNNTALQLSQLIKFNALKRQQDQKVINARHRPSQITTLPVYTGLLLHSRTHGLSISYNRVDEIQSAIVMCAKNIKQKDWFILLDSVFTTAGIGNVDHNASSSTSKNYFHGTSIPLSQHLDSPAANHQIVFDLSSKALGGQRDFKLSSYYTFLEQSKVTVK